ncbi:hypothetical protein AAJP47_00550 [Psychrobacter sp. B38]|uniref:hypothetical protein n=1 Tax=Psychrobacter sp. B38 TaxID=3143538 RepID=UPI00320E0443
MTNAVKEIESHLESKIKTACNNFLLSKGWSSTLPNTYELSLVKYLDFIDILSIKDKSWQCVELPNLEYPPDLKTGYENLKKALTNGKDIDKYMSKGIFRGNNDAMFNDWGILHFHLGSQLDNTGKYIERTKELVFIRFYEENAYIIAIGKHGDWTKQNLIEKLENHAPNSISHGLINIMDVSSSVSDTDLDLLRKKKANSAIKLPSGNSYMSINSGYSISGNKTTSSIGLAAVSHYIHKLAKLILHNNPSIDIDELALYNFKLSDTNWGYIVKGVAFVNIKNGKFLYSTDSETQYSEKLS